MNRQAYIHLLQQPEQITSSEIADIRAILDQFPYFQSAHALYLKGLKNQESFSYNKALKTTAAHTTDRSVLFDYITSTIFEQNTISEQIKHQEAYLRDLIIYDALDLSVQVATEELDKASKILDPELFVPGTTENPLQLGKPLVFDKSETHSFNEWLKLSHFQPILREGEGKDPHSHEATVYQEEKELSLTTAEVSRKRKQRLIDSFIATNPKIEINNPATPGNKNLAKERLIPSKALMTETLARVYIEQKNYKKAKQAYRILSLKYPEKSGFFADQIREIEQLEEDTAL